MSRVKLYFAKVNENGVIPSKRDCDAGMDIYACFEEDSITINPHETKMIATGIMSACSEDYYFQLFERGSTGTKGIGQRCGVIEGSYRGEWFVPITNHNDKPLVIVKEEPYLDYFKDKGFVVYPYKKGICQALLLPVSKVDII